MHQQRRVILKDETANIEGIFSDAAVDMIAADMIVLIDNDNILIALLQKDGRGDKSANARPQNHDLKSVRRAAVIRSRGNMHIIQISLQRKEQVGKDD
jgi:hypothetical protein